MFKSKILLVYIINIFMISKYLQAVEIEFNVVQVPKYYTPLNDDIFISGSFNNWVPNLYKLSRLSYSYYKIILDLPVGSYQYKFTRGSWLNGESNSDGSLMSNRNLQINSSSKQSLLIKIQNWNDYKGKHTATGNVHILDTKFAYPQFNTTKQIWIYLPPDYYISMKSYSVLYMHDAQNLFDNLYSFAGEWGIDEAIENFFEQGKETSIIVGIENKNERINELTPYSNQNYGGGQGDRYLDFLINHIKPYIDRNFRTKNQKEYTGIAGSSLGGLMSFYVGLKYQNIFGKIAVFSPSFWFSDKIYELIASNQIIKHNDTRIYFVCGQQESDNMVKDMLKMVNLLYSNGYENINYLTKSDGTHSEWFWRREFPNAYSWLFMR